MKILVISDSHLFGNDLQRVVKKYQHQVDYICLLYTSKHIHLHRFHFHLHDK